MQAQVNDITENIKLQKELSAQKQQMVEAVLNAQENERKIIGRELHDNINQVLTAVKLNLGLALEFKDNTPLIQKCERNIENVMEEIRKLSKQLILPGNLKELGLVQSIEDMMSEALHLKGINWKMQAKGVKDHAFSEEQKLTIYRIVQEQLNNIMKHACATSVVITLTQADSKVLLKMEDNGKGFDPKMHRSGVGITNIINRAELFNGTVKIHSEVGNGCRLEVVLNSKHPLPLKTLKNPVLVN